MYSSWKTCMFLASACCSFSPTCITTIKVVNYLQSWGCGLQILRFLMGDWDLNLFRLQVSLNTIMNQNIQNTVCISLGSDIFTLSLRELELFLSIANELSLEYICHHNLWTFQLIKLVTRDHCQAI